MNDDSRILRYRLAVEYYDWAVREYKSQLESGVSASDLQRFRDSVLVPARLEARAISLKEDSAEKLMLWTKPVADSATG